MRKQVIDIESRHADQNADATVQLAKLAAEVVRIRKELMLPLNEEMAQLTDKITAFAKERSADARSAADAEAAAVARTSLIVGVVVALLLIGACVFSISTNARPMRALSAAMEELARGRRRNKARPMTPA